jgi:cell division protein FtsL
MQLQKNTSISKLSGLTKLLIKTALVFLVIFIVSILIDKIDFPSPNKKIEKIIPNENLKIIK